MRYFSCTCLFQNFEDKLSYEKSDHKRFWHQCCWTLLISFPVCIFTLLWAGNESTAVHRFCIHDGHLYALAHVNVHCFYHPVIII